MNSRKNQVIVQGIFWILGIVGLFYAASRTLHFVENTMPDEEKINGYLYLFFTGGGAFLWAQVYLKHAVGSVRRATSFLLAIGDLLAEIVLVYADTQYVANANGLVVMSQAELKTFITATVGIVAINLIGWFVYHLNDPTHRKESMAQDLADEVEEATYKQLNTPAERQALVNNLMPAYGAAVIADVTKAIHERAGLISAKGTPFEPKQAEVSQIGAPANQRTGVWVPEHEYRRLEALYPPYDPSKPPPIIEDKDEPAAAKSPFLAE